MESISTDTNDVRLENRSDDAFMLDKRLTRDLFPLPHGEQAPSRKKNVRLVLNLLAYALAPLTKEVLLELAPALDRSMLDDALAALCPLIVRVRDELTRGYVFTHPRLGDYVRQQLTPHAQQQFQRRFLHYGRQTLEGLNNGTLHRQNASSYAIQYYGAHLERADAPPDAFYALVSKGWMAAWEAVEGTYAVNDIERAWQRAERERNIAMQIKCALCRASITAVAELTVNIPPKLLVEAVKHGVLTPIQGLGLFEKMTDRSQIGDALSELASFLPKALLPQALSTAQRINNQEACAQVLWQLACHQPAQQRAITLSEALKAALMIEDEEARTKTLKWLTPHLPDELRASALIQALKAVLMIEYEWERAEKLRWLAPHLPLCEALKIVLAIEDKWERAEALEALLMAYLPFSQEADRFIRYWEEQPAEAEGGSSLTPELPEKRLAQTLDAARAIQSEWDRAKALEELAPHLPNELLSQALEVSLAIRDQACRVKALWALAPHLPDEQRPIVLSEALQAAQTIDWKKARAKLLRRVAPYLSDELRPIVLSEAREATQAIAYEWFRKPAFWRLAPHLPVELLGQALEAALAIGSEQDRARGLWNLARHLPVELLGQALEAALAIGSEPYRAEVLSSLARHLPVERAIENQYYRGQALCRLAPHLPNERLAQALKAVQAIENRSYRGRALEGLAPHLPDELLLQSLEAALGRSEAHRIQALECFVPYLSTELLGKVLDAALALEDQECHVQVLQALGSHLPEERLDQALEAALALENESYRARALNPLVPHLPEEGLAQALDAALAIKDESFRASLLQSLALAPHLPEERRAILLSQALEAALGIKGVRRRAETLEELTPHLPEELRPIALSQALEDAFALAYAPDLVRADLLGDLAPHLSDWAQAQPHTAYPTWQKSLRRLSTYTRHQFLDELYILMPFTLAVAGKEVELEVKMDVKAIFRVIQEVCEWWP